MGTQKKQFAQQIAVDSLKNVLTSATTDSSKVELLVSLADFYKDKNIDSTIIYAKMAQLIAEKNNDSELMVDLSMKLMQIVFYIRQHKKLSEAVALIYIGISLREKAGNDFLLTGSYINLAICYYYDRKYDEALTSATRAKENALKFLNSPDPNQKNGAVNGLGDCFFYLGEIYYEKGNYEMAIKHFTESVYYREIYGDQRRKAQSLNGLARIYIKQSNYPAAMSYFLAALTIYYEIPFYIGVAMVLRNIGNLYDVQQSYNQALTYYHQSLSVMKGKKSNFDIHLTCQMMGACYLEICGLPENKLFEAVPSLRNYTLKRASGILADSAGFYLSLAYDLSKQADDELTMIKSLLGLADIAVRQNDFDNAFLQLNEAVSLAREIEAKPELFRCYHKLSHISEQYGRIEDAYNYYKLYTIIKDSVFNENSARQIAEIQIKYETEIKDRKIQLLHKDNEIKSLQLEQKEASIRASELEREKNLDELRLLIAAKDLQELQLARTKDELDHQHLQREVQAAELELITKDKKIQEEKLARQKVQRDGIFIITVFLILVGFLLFRSQLLRKKLEKQEAVIQERKRISADLHDDIGTGLSKISLLSELVKSNAKVPETKKEAEKIAITSKQLLQSISEIIWALNSNNDFVENLVAYIRRYAAEYFDNVSVKLIISIPDFISPIPISGERRRNIFFSVKEAMHNVVKHAEASEVELNFSVKNDVLTIVIHDNGKGMPHAELNRFGNGLINMQHRMKSIQGNFSIENHVGTKITLSVPV
jgi:signal transduction histidine kinase/tetratricopeptide (TPR) repeat protein